MESKKIVIPLKCSTVKSVNSVAEVVIEAELLIYCIVSTVWMTLVILGIVQLPVMGPFYFTGCGFGVVGMVFFIAYAWDNHGRKWYNENIPSLECIKDDEFDNVA